MDKNRLTQVGRAMQELGVPMIPAYSPQARGRSERSFGTWQGRLPQELRLAGMTTLEGADAFLNEHYIGEFNGKFTVPAKEKGTAFRKTARHDLDWVFTVQTERVVGKDNTVAIGDRNWQLGRSRFRHTLAGTTVTIHEHLDGRVSVRWGRRWSRERRLRNKRGRAVEKTDPWKRWKAALRFPTAPTTPATRPKAHLKTRKPPSASRRGSSGSMH